MKRFLYISMIALAVTLGFVACDYDDSDIKDDIEDLQDRVSDLEDLVSDLQDDIASLQTLVSAVEGNDWITSVTSFDDGTNTGWIITFNSYGTITIYNGVDGTDGYTPTISVTLVDGVYYWTIDGEIATDSNGDPIPASPTDGSAGVTPQLKIGDDGAWYYSVDGGTTWTYLADADWGSDASGTYSSLFSSIEYDDEYVYFYLSDGTTFTVARDVEFGITLGSTSVSLGSGESVTVLYVVTGADDDTVVKVYAQNDYTASVTESSTSSGTITIAAPSSGATDTEVWVFLSDGDQKLVTATIEVTSTDTGGEK